MAPSPAAEPHPAMPGPLIRADLTFASPELEAAFQRHTRASKAATVGRFAFLRAMALLIVAARALLAGDCRAFVLKLVLVASSFMPLAAASPSRLVDAAVLATDVLLGVVGCLNMKHIAPSQDGVALRASLAHVVHGSGMLWIWFYSAFSPLPFRLQLLSQAVVCVVLLAFSERICSLSWGLRCGYHTLGCLLGWPHPAGWPLACLQQIAQAPAAARAAMQACQRWQVGVLLLPGFVGATWAIFRAERRLRLAFLRATRSPIPVHAMPSDLDFLFNLALPATLAMWLYAGSPQPAV